MGVQLFWSFTTYIKHREGSKKNVKMWSLTTTGGGGICSKGTSIVLQGAECGKIPHFYIFWDPYLNN